jgi:proline iminopeptidase
MTNMSIRDVSLFVEVVGNGYPLVLMHGGPSQDYTSLLHLRPCADQFTLIYYDHRCNGHSDGAEVTSMTWENLTADAEALRQELGFEKWAVLGHSFGGNVALEYALRYPQSLSHLILMNTGGDYWWAQENAAKLLAKRGYRPGAVQACHRFFNGQFTLAEYSSTFLKFWGAYFYRINLLRLTWEMLVGPRPKLRPEALVFAGKQLLNGWTIMDRLGEIRVPALVIAGRQDFLYPPEHQAIVADRLPNAELVLIERAGHNPHMERQAEVIAEIRRFLASADRS